MNTDTKNKYLSEAKKYFDRRSHDDDLLKAAISELLNVIADLYEIRKSERDTSLYINNWRNSKLKKTIIVKNEVGKLVEADLDTISWDMSQHDRFLNWLFEFFYKLYEKKTGKTISFAYALDTLTIYHNQQILNKRLLFKKEVDRPNCNIDDIFDVLDYEQQETDTTFLSQQKVPTSSVATLEIRPKYSISKILENYQFWNDSQRAKKNIFKNSTEDNFLNMIITANFSVINNVRGQSQRVKYNLIVLARILGNEWGKKAAANEGTSLRECGKCTLFDEFDELKDMYMQ